MIKQEIRSLIINLSPKYEETERHHPRVVDSVIEKVLAEFYNLVFLRSPLELQRHTKQFGYTVAIAVAYEAATQLYYSNLPTGIDIIPFPDKASGVRRISTPIQGGATFYPMDVREMDLIQSGSYVHTLTDKVGYATRRTRIEYYNMSAAIVTSGVRLDLIIPFSQFLDTDTVLVPELVNNDGQGFIDRALQVLSAVKPVELFENKTFEENKQ